MGNWRNRPHRRFYRQDRAPKYPPSYHDPEPSLSEFCNDGLPLWEKKFCTLVGKISWRKIVDTKKFMCYSDNVLNWDDSAGKEAFQNAKKCYWAEINGFSCDISAPDPNAYIDEINWNPYIDPELIRDLEQEYFAPNDGEEDGKVGRENKMARNFSSAPLEECNTNPYKVDNPWECNNVTQVIDGSKNLLGWGQLVTKVDDSMNLNSNRNNPWENSITHRNESGKHNSWGDYESRDWNTGNNSWGHSCQGIGSKKDDGWGDFKWNSWGRNQWDDKKLSNGDNSRERSFVQQNGDPNDRGWADCGRNSWGWKPRENHNIGSRKLDFRRTSSSGSRKREGSHQYIPGYKSSRFQRDDNQTSHCWRRKPNKKDLKVSNILLDENMNPKISDFEMARIYKTNEAEPNTNRIVGTYFGVMVLEVVSGQKNTSNFHFDLPLNLVGYVSIRIGGSVDPTLNYSCSKHQRNATTAAKRPCIFHRKKYHRHKCGGEGDGKLLIELPIHVRDGCKMIKTRIYSPKFSFSLSEIKSEKVVVLHDTYAKFSDLTSRSDLCGCKPTEEDVKRCFMLEFNRFAIIKGLKGVWRLQFCYCNCGHYSSIDSSNSSRAVPSVSFASRKMVETESIKHLLGRCWKLKVVQLMKQLFHHCRPQYGQ
ncbi:hypothetical protein CRYUN_Cryun05aG0141000 [Craigia yunnanensis]